MDYYKAIETYLGESLDLSKEDCFIREGEIVKWDITSKPQPTIEQLEAIGADF